MGFRLEPGDKVLPPRVSEVAMRSALPLADMRAGPMWKAEVPERAKGKGWIDASDKDTE